MEFIIGYERDDNEHVQRDISLPVMSLSDHKPCKAAYQKPNILIRESMSIDQKFVDLKYYPAFTSQGIKHRISKGGNGNFYLERQMRDQTWYVELNSLDDLLALQDEINRPLIVHHLNPSGRIYEDYDTGKTVHVDEPKQYYITIQVGENYVTLD
jgi:hypothetical protein